MTANTNSPFVNFKSMTPPFQGDRPPNMPLGRDPRKPECAHSWDGTWGDPGERQHLCSYCDRWIWEHSITEAVDFGAAQTVEDRQ